MDARKRSALWTRTGRAFADLDRGMDEPRGESILTVTYSVSPGGAAMSNKSTKVTGTTVTVERSGARSVDLSRLLATEGAKRQLLAMNQIQRRISGQPDVAGGVTRK